MEGNHLGEEVNATHALKFGNRQRFNQRFALYGGQGCELQRGGVSWRAATTRATHPWNGLAIDSVVVLVCRLQAVGDALHVARLGVTHSARQ